MFERFLLSRKKIPIKPKTIRTPTRIQTRLANNLAHNNLSPDDLKLKELRDSVELYKQFGNYENPQNMRMGSLLHELAKHYGKLGDYLNSKETFEKALNIFEKCADKSDVDVGVICSNLADVHYNLKNIEKSTELYEQALCIFEKHYNKDDPNHPRTNTIRQKLARNQNIKDPQKAWGNHQNFYSIKHSNDDLPTTCPPESETHHQYLDLTPRYYNL